MKFPKTRLTGSGDPCFLDAGGSPPKPFFEYFFGMSLVALGAFSLLLTWAFSTMVNPELQGAEWWSAVTGSLGFRSGVIFSLVIVIGGVWLLIRSPEP